MSHLSQNLEKLIQMISIEQLLGLVKQNTNNIKANTNTDVLSLPIVQKVVNAYEEEINILNTRMNTNFNSADSGPTSNISNIPPVKDYSEDISKIHEQLGAINNSLLQLSEAIKSISFNPASKFTTEKFTTEKFTTEKFTNTSLNNNEEHIQLKIEEIKSVNLEIEVELEVEDSDDEIELSDLEEDIIVSDEIVSDEIISAEVKIIKIDNSTVVNSSVVNLEAESESEVDESEKEISDSEEELSVAEEEELVEEEEISVAEEEEISVAEEEEISVAEEEEISETEVEVSAKEEEEEEEEVFEIEIDDVTYYATSEENGILYEVDADGEVGKQVGVIKDGEPIFS